MSVDRLRCRVARLEREKRARAVQNSPLYQLQRAERADARGEATLAQYGLVHRDDAAWVRAAYLPAIPALVALARLGADLWWMWFRACTFPPGEQLPASVADDIEQEVDFAESLPPDSLRLSSPKALKFRTWADARSDTAREVIAFGGREAMCWRTALWVQVQGEWRLRPEVIAASERYVPTRMSEYERSSLYWSLNTKLKEFGGAAPFNWKEVRYADIVHKAVELASQDGIPPSWSNQVSSGHPPTSESVVQ